DREMETGKDPRACGASALGFRAEFGYCRLIAVRDWRLEVARKSRVTTRVLDYRNGRPKYLKQIPISVRGVKFPLKTDCSVAQLLRNAVSARRRGRVYRRRYRGHELSNRAGREDEHRRHRRRRR